jgi:hypothetical protein
MHGFGYKNKIQNMFSDNNFNNEYTFYTEYKEFLRKTDPDAVLRVER